MVFVRVQELPYTAREFEQRLELLNFDESANVGNRARGSVRIL